MKPVIGITCNYDWKDTVGQSSCMGIAGQDWNFLAGDYIYAIEKFGGIPVILPRMKDTSNLKPFLETLDGILISGGHDVDPRTYGARISGKCGRIVPERDTMDLTIAQTALKLKKPLLGICRGIQILAAVTGGTLYQDLESEGSYQHHFMDSSPRQYPVHQVYIEKNSRLGKIFGKSIIEVNSYHHQAVKSVGKDMKIIARSDDGVIEGIEGQETDTFVLGVQWHPEMMFTSEEQGKIFQNFIAACR